MALEFKIITEISDMEIALAIYQNNSYYFAKTTEEKPTLQSIKNDMVAIPPNVLEKQKEYALIKYQGKFVGVIDLIKYYPSANTHYIGLFILDKKVQGNHLGTNIMEEIIRSFKKEGINKIRLSVVLDNKKAFLFWQKLGFKVLEEKNIELSERVKKLVAVMELTI